MKEIESNGQSYFQIHKNRVSNPINRSLILNSNRQNPQSVFSFSITFTDILKNMKTRSLRKLKRQTTKTKTQRPYTRYSTNKKSIESITSLKGPCKDSLKQRISRLIKDNSILQWRQNELQINNSRCDVLNNTKSQRQFMKKQTPKFSEFNNHLQKYQFSELKESRIHRIISKQKSQCSFQRQKSNLESAKQRPQEFRKLAQADNRSWRRKKQKLNQAADNKQPKLSMTGLDFRRIQKLRCSRKNKQLIDLKPWDTNDAIQNEFL